jgi:sulfate permease, SulP family
MTNDKKQFLEIIFPPLVWLNYYKKETFISDLTAGVTTAVMLIPQGMAYALLAGLDPIIGLYASVLPLIIYALLGSSRQLSVGPIAMASLLMAAGTQQLVSAHALSEGDKLTIAILITLIVGIIQLLMGVLKLGGVVNLLSHPVVTGFTAAAALVIGSSQLQHLVGFSIPGGLPPHEQLLFLIANIGEVHPSTLIVGVIAIFSLISIKKLSPQAPSAIIVVLVGIISSYLLDFKGLRVPILGEIPSGLPSFQMPQHLEWEMIQSLIPTSFAVALVAFMESISAAKVYARQNRYQISPSQELISLGLSNVGSAFTSGCVVGGALSRTAVNAQAGAKSPFANVITAFVIGVTLAFLTEPFAYLPKPILAAIIMVAVVSLIDIEEVKHLWEIKRDDLVICVITFLSTLLIGVSAGILVGVLASLLWLVYTSTRPYIAILGRLPETTSYRSIEHFSEAEAFDRILIMRMDAQFFFGNVSHLKESISDQLSNSGDIVALVIDASSMNALDSTAADAFSEMIKSLRNTGVEVMISHVKGSVLQVMEAAGIAQLLGSGHLFYEVHDAVQAALRHRDAVDSGISVEEEEFGPSDEID